MNADGAAGSQYASTATDQLGLPAGTRRALFDSLDVVLAEHKARATVTAAFGSGVEASGSQESDVDVGADAAA